MTGALRGLTRQLAGVAGLRVLGTQGAFEVLERRPRRTTGFVGTTVGCKGLRDGKVSAAQGTESSVRGG